MGRHDYQDQFPQEPVPRALRLHCDASFQGAPGAQQRPDPLLPQAISRACNPLGETDDDAGHEGGYGLGPRFL